MRWLSGVIAVVILGLALAGFGIAGVAGFTPTDFEFRTPRNTGQAVVAHLGSDLSNPFGRRRTDVISKVAPVFTARGDERARLLATAIESLSERLSMTPTDGFAWLGYAELLELRDGYGPGVDRALSLSYYTTPLEEFIMLDRIRFSLRLWDRISPELQRNARLEIEALAPWTGAEITQILADAALAAGPAQVALTAEEIKSVSEFSGRIFDHDIEVARSAPGKR